MIFRKQYKPLRRISNKGRTFSTIFPFNHSKTMAAKSLKSKVDTYNPEHKEGKVATAIEKQTAKLPSDVFLWAALGSIAVSLTLKIMRKDEEALFVGQWPAPFLLLGVYNKLVKQEGHD